MSEEAIATQDDIQDELEGEELENELELENESDDEVKTDDEFEVVYEGEDEPSSKTTVPLTSYLKRVAKLTGKVKAVSSEAEERIAAAERKAEMLNEELKLYQLKQQGKPQTRPKAEDFDTDELYDAALDEYYEAKFDAKVNEKLTTQVQTQQTQASQVQNEKKLETALTEHYNRAATLKVPDYDETEDRAIEILGNDVAKHIMANSSKSQELMYFLGKEVNEAKALYYKNLIAENPVRGLMELGGLADKLKAKPKRSTAPDPETRLNGGGEQTTADAWQRKISKARDKVAAGTMKMADLLAIKKQAKDAGVKL